MKSRWVLITLVLVIVLGACNPPLTSQPTPGLTLATSAPTETAAVLTAELCLHNTQSDPECKDCCDSLDATGEARKSCRDSCLNQDFSQNSNFISFTANSILGPNGDYTACTELQGEPACKACCDGSDALQAGDRRFCRDACLQASPAGGPESQIPAQPGSGPAGEAAGYNLEQAVSDKAQGMTIAYDALAFLTGDLGSDSFFPPGKVADFWGFQYLRDNDPSEMGHAGDFLTSAALNMLTVLNAEQRAELVMLAESQVDDINAYGYKRFVLMQAFRRLLENDLPAGTTGLDETAVKAYSAELYQLDGKISLARAELMGQLLSSLDSEQKAYLDGMVGKGMLEWPAVAEPADLRNLDREVKVAVMTYAADMYSWYAGSIEADVYFCPERHGTYFGSFYLKDRPAMDDSSYAIPTELTGNMGEALLNALTPEQAKLITDLVDVQRPYLTGIVEARRQVSTEFRKYLSGEGADEALVQELMGQYGELDGEIIYNLAVNFTEVSQSLTAEQKAQLLAMRQEMLGDLLYPSGAYLYSQPIFMPEIPDTDFLFK